ncbi:MAG: DUF4215 domain-containing protein [Phycisphaerales bacterium]|nr:DUF4215 domain-containing protein [Phycisphaerales bacterium]
MKLAIAALAFVVAGAGALNARAGILIDDFTTGQGPLTLTAPGGVGGTIGSVVSGGGILLTERDIEVNMTAGAGGLDITVLVIGGTFNHSQDVTVKGKSLLAWDGVDGSSSLIDHDGLGGIDLTSLGLDDSFLLSMISADSGTIIVFEVFTDASNSSTLTLNLTGGAFMDDFVLPFANFVTNLGAGADFTNVGAITIKVDGTATSAIDVTFDMLDAQAVVTSEKTDALFTDVDMDGSVDVGDTIKYTVTITNPDDDADYASAAILFTDAPGANTALVVGSVTSSQGSVTTGNTGGDTTVAVNVGPIADNTSVTIMFTVVVTGPPVSLEVCNQGFVNGTQPTDDPGTGTPDDPTCTPVTFCGDGIVNDITEQCDDGNVNNNDACLDTCLNATCGDGFVWNQGGGTEECDDADANNNDSCIDTCLNATCGDSYVWNQDGGTEECDDADANNNDSCIDTCELATCGDTYVWNQDGGTEQCDDANANNNDACLTTCLNATCGDSFVWNQGGGTEQCDDANANNNDACLTTCLNATCGDGFVFNQGGGTEQCDDDNANNNDACLTTCLNATCGDGFVFNQGGGTEQCDDDNANNNDACLTTCVNATCGDGVVFNQGGGTEQCDTSGASATCDANCTNATCGDGTFNPAAGEQCDSGGVATPTCDPNCTLAECGDGFRNAAAGEECDGADAVFCPGECLIDCSCPESAVPPVPTVTQWGLFVMTLLGMCVGTIEFGRRRKPGVA